MAFIKNLFSKLARKKSQEDIEETELEKDSLLKGGCNCNNCNNDEKEKNPKTLCIHIDPLPCEPNPFFQCKEEFTKFFTEFESKITTIYRYYNMNNIFLKEYLSKSKEALQASRENRDENFQRYSSCYFINNNSFKDIHYMSTLMNVYMSFETLLKSLSKDVAYDSNKSIEDVQDSKNIPYLNGYMTFLEEAFNNRGLFTGRENEFVNIIRKIRNDYIHDSQTEIPEGMERDIVKLFNLREGKRITVDDMLINNTFEIFGQIATKLEKAYWAYKKNYLKTVIK
ncbi:hypothetical protein [Cetobacterium sp. SF1]|uniref:hypothetical protein n=1 Tax=unclassified Cetobacterium TaxID=2630983 RepID=UPI003CEBFF70